MKENKVNSGRRLEILMAHHTRRFVCNGEIKKNNKCPHKNNNSSHFLSHIKREETIILEERTQRQTEKQYENKNIPTCIPVAQSLDSPKNSHFSFLLGLSARGGFLLLKEGSDASEAFTKILGHANRGLHPGR